MINDERNFSRDTRSKALINTNKEAYDQYKRMKRRECRLNEIEEKVNTLSNDISEIKSLLKQTLDRK